jgi:hypothetical protein
VYAEKKYIGYSVIAFPWNTNLLVGNKRLDYWKEQKRRRSQKNNVEIDAFTLMFYCPVISI